MDDDFQSADSGASKTFPKQCSALRKGEHVMIKGHPCKISEMSTSKTGKHGHAKVNLVGYDIFDQKKYEDICPSTHNMDVPNVSHADYLVVLVEDGHFTLVDDNGTEKLDMKVPDSMKNIFPDDFDKEDHMVTVLTAMGREAVISYKSPKAN